MPLSTGMLDKKDLKAFKPPAEAPMPTIRPVGLSLAPEFRSERASFSARLDLDIRAMPLAFVNRPAAQCEMSAVRPAGEPA